MWQLAWSAALALGVECAEPVSPEELDTALQHATDAYRDMDDAGFRDRVNELAGLLLPCVDQAVPPPLVARTHLVMAMHLHAIGDTERAGGALAAARHADPEAVLDPELVPPSHPLHEHWEGAAPTGATRRVPEPRHGSLAFDGSFGRDRPRDHPTLAQLFDASGIATSTHYLGAREPLPAYAAVPRRRNALLGCAGGAGALAAGSFALGWGANSRTYANAADPTFAADELDGSRAAANAWTLASSGLLAIGAGCGTAAVLTGAR